MRTHSPENERINRAADDPAGLAISENLRAQIKGANMAAENIANANSFINTADGFLQNVSDILGRLEELSVAYGDPTKSTEDKANLSVDDLFEPSVRGEEWQLPMSRG